jgi:hypothetical protein
VQQLASSHDGEAETQAAFAVATLCLRPHSCGEGVLKKTYNEDEGSDLSKTMFSLSSVILLK